MADRRRPVSVAGAARDVKREEKKLMQGKPIVTGVNSMPTADSFQNLAAKLGMNQDNLLSQGSYGFNPISRQRVMLEWIHRGSWLGGVAVDIVANDMTRAGVNLKGDLDPDDIQRIEEHAISFGVWNRIQQVIQWSRLYGGCLGVMLVDGQDVKTPLRLETVSKDQFKGMFVLDRWMVEPDLSNLVTEMGPSLGHPKWYKVINRGAPAFGGEKIHHSRCLRLVGIELPYWQSLAENMWGISIIERLYDRMVAFDSATTGAAQLVYKAYLRTYKIKDFRDLVAGGGPPLDGLVKYIDMMRRFQSIEGITLLDSEDDFAGHSHTAFGGLSDALQQFAMQLAGALQIPLTRLFGKSPDGLNATGESDLRTYYDGIAHEQVTNLGVPVTIIYRAMAQSLGITVPDGFGVAFRPLWQLTEKEKSEIATSVTEAVTKGVESALISPQTALKELKQSSNTTGIWSNITDADIAAAEAEPIPQPDPNEPEGGFGNEGGGSSSGSSSDKNKPDGAASNSKDRRARSKKTKDSNTTEFAYRHGLFVVIETPAGHVRKGVNNLNGTAWEVTMPVDYGYIRNHIGADEDQIDCYLGPNPMSEEVFVIDQLDLATNKFDEHKVMLGYQAWRTAKDDYVLSFSDGRGPQRIGAMTEMSMQEFKKWLETANLEAPCSVGLS
jgi:phage-related protein (TIGR01555 family)